MKKTRAIIRVGLETEEEGKPVFVNTVVRLPMKPEDLLHLLRDAADHMETYFRQPMRTKTRIVWIRMEMLKSTQPN